LTYQIVRIDSVVVYCDFTFITAFESGKKFDWRLSLSTIGLPYVWLSHVLMVQWHGTGTGYQVTLARLAS